MCFSHHSPSNDKKAARARTASRLSSVPPTDRNHALWKTASYEPLVITKAKGTQKSPRNCSSYTRQLNHIFTRHRTDLSPEISENKRSRKKFQIFSVTVSPRTLFKITVKLWLLNNWRKKECTAEKRYFSQNGLNECNKMDVWGFIILFCSLFCLSLKFSIIKSF